MAELKTNYKDQILDTNQNTRRKYRMITNDDGTVSFEDVTVYTQQGDYFGAGDINATNEAIKNMSSQLDGDFIPTSKLINNDAYASDTVWSSSQTKAMLDKKQNVLTNPLTQSSVVNHLLSTSATAPLSAYQGNVLNGKIDGKQDKLTNPLTQSSVVNNLISTSATAPLSAAQGKVLNDKIAGISNVTVTNNLTSTSTTAALSAYQGNVLNSKMNRTNTYAAGNCVVKKIGNCCYAVALNDATLNDIEDMHTSIKSKMDYTVMCHVAIRSGDYRYSGYLEMSNTGVSAKYYEPGTKNTHDVGGSWTFKGNFVFMSNNS